MPGARNILLRVVRWPRLPSATRALCVLAFLIISSLLSTTAQAAQNRSSFAQVVDTVQPKIAKIYGAGGIRGLEAYQSGMLISADGHVLTVTSHVLDTDSISVVLNDGREFNATQVDTDPRLELAVLKIDAADLDFFDLEAAVEAGVASRVLAFSNLFGVATGNEPASVMQGWIAAKTMLNARRGTFKTPYRGPVYILDAVTNNPGAAGGALTNRRGELVGMLGKELRNTLTTTWLNYALPATELRTSVKDILSGTTRSRADDDRDRPDKPLTLAALGIMLVPDVIQRTPSYVDAIHRGSAAETAGLRRDDLVVMLNGRTVISHRALSDELSYLKQDSQVIITVVRDSELLDVPLQLQSDTDLTDDATVE